LPRPRPFPDIGGNPLLELIAGDYTLTIDAAGDATGSFAFRLLDVADATPITPGTAATGSLSPGNETDLYQFSATAGQSFYFDAQLFSATTDGMWRLFGPAGNLVFSNYGFADQDVLTLPHAGTYTLAIEGRRYQTAVNNYRVLVQPQTDAAPVRITAIESVPAPDLTPVGLQVSSASGAIEAGSTVTVLIPKNVLARRTTVPPSPMSVLPTRSARAPAANRTLPRRKTSRQQRATGTPARRTATTVMTDAISVPLSVSPPWESNLSEPSTARSLSHPERSAASMLSTRARRARPQNAAMAQRAAVLGVRPPVSSPNTWGRRKHANPITSGYSMRRSKSTGESRALHTPPSTPPNDMMK
jgi:hypothetical protein